MIRGLKIIGTGVNARWVPVAMPSQATPEQITEYHRLYDAYYHSHSRYRALESQGKHCPTNVLEESLKDWRAQYARYMEYQNKIWPPETKMHWFVRALWPRLNWVLFCFITAYILWNWV